MATVWIPALLRPLTHGQDTVQVEGATVRQVIANLNSLFPGIKNRILDGDELRTGLAVAVDSQMGRLSLSHPVGENSEVHFVPAISGGAFVLDTRHGSSLGG